MTRAELKQLNQSLRRMMRVAVAYRRMVECSKKLTNASKWRGTYADCTAHSKAVDRLLIANGLLTDDDISRVEAVLEKP